MCGGGGSSSGSCELGSTRGAGSGSGGVSCVCGGGTNDT